MRWTRKTPPKEGEIRIISKFLFLPRTIKDEKRWLERVYIKQKFVYKTVMFGYMFTIHGFEEPRYPDKWVDQEFLDLPGDDQIKELSEILH